MQLVMCVCVCVCVCVYIYISSSRTYLSSIKHIYIYTLLISNFVKIIYIFI